MSSVIFEPFRLGDLKLSNRLVMAPMTRNRAGMRGEPTPAMVEYYRQRASAGLIIAESTAVTATGLGYPFTPGIYTDEQASSWLRVTNAVHSAGGRIFLQIFHAGRISHPNLLDGTTPVAPSAVPAQGQAMTYEGPMDFVVPRALGADEIPGVVDSFRAAATRALRAGFDGVEVHAGNGYLIDQFLRDGTNHRDDGYGGDHVGRMRFLNEVLDAVTNELPAGRVGVRFTPENPFNSMSDSEPASHFGYFLAQLTDRRLAYVHVLEGDMSRNSHIAAGFAATGATGPGGSSPGESTGVAYAQMREAFPGVYIANNGYDIATASAAVECGHADLVAFGTPFLANPDLVRRYRDGLPLNTADPSTFYGGDDRGHTDYPHFRPADSGRDGDPRAA